MILAISDAKLRLISFLMFVCNQYLEIQMRNCCFLYNPKHKCKYKVTNRDVELGLVSRPTCKMLLWSSPSKANASQLASSLIKMMMLMMEMMTMMLMRSSPSKTNASQLTSSLMMGKVVMRQSLEGFGTSW